MGKNTHPELTSSWRNDAWVTVVLALLLAGSLVDVPIFNRTSLSAYFFFVLGASLIILGGGVILLLMGRPRVAVPKPVIPVMVWGIFILVQAAVIFRTWNLWDNYLFVGCLFLCVLMILFRRYGPGVLRLFTLIAVIAVAESVLCVLQWVKLLPSLNPFFDVTGSWSNPNVTAMFLAMSLPAVGFLFLDRRGEISRRISVASLVAIVAILAAMLLLKCRTAFIGGLVVAIVLAEERFRLSAWMRSNRMQALVLICGLVATAIFGYRWKAGSADGRVLIWKLSLGLICRQPLTGIGYGMFEHAYNIEQADYFAGDGGTKKERRLAGHVNMAYNEYLQHAVEGGLPGLFLMAGVFVVFLLPGRPAGEERLAAIAAWSGVMAMAVMSFFNFTFQAMPVFCLFAVYAAQWASMRKARVFSMRAGITGVVVAGMGLVLVVYQGVLAGAYRSLRAAELAIGQADYGVAGNILTACGPVLQASDSYWECRGSLFQAERGYAGAVEAFGRAKTLTSDPQVYLRDGICEQRLGNYQPAEQDFRLVADMEPQRMRPRFLLMRLYEKEKDSVAARRLAGELLALDEKRVTKQGMRYKQRADSVAGTGLK